MTEYLNKSFSVLPGKDGGQKYRDNWERIFKKPAPVKEPALWHCDVCGIEEGDPSGPCSCKPTSVP